LRELFSAKIDRYLDAGSGGCWMNRSAGLKHWRWVGVPAEHRRDADAT
jgi:hypothetical protein